MVIEKRISRGSSKKPLRCSTHLAAWHGRSSFHAVSIVQDRGRFPLVSEHTDIVSGIAEGKRVVAEDDFDYTYRLLTQDGCKVATFAAGRIGYRGWAIRRGYISSQDDKLDKDVDEVVQAS